MYVCMNVSKNKNKLQSIQSSLDDDDDESAWNR